MRHTSSVHIPHPNNSSPLLISSHPHVRLTSAALPTSRLHAFCVSSFRTCPALHNTHNQTRTHIMNLLLPPPHRPVYPHTKYSFSSIQHSDGLTLFTCNSVQFKLTPAQQCSPPARTAISNIQLGSCVKYSESCRHITLISINRVSFQLV